MQMDLAGTYYREEGAVRFIVHAQRGAETATGLTLADDLAALFRNKKFDGVQTFAPSSPIMDDRNEEGMYFSLSSPSRTISTSPTAPVSTADRLRDPRCGEVSWPAAALFLGEDHGRRHHHRYGRRGSSSGRACRRPPTPRPNSRH